jgi:hypothetical protein
MTVLLRRSVAALALLVLALPLASQAPTRRVTINAVFPPLSYLPFPGTQYANDFLTYVASSPLVDGVNPPLLWSLVDKGPGAPGGQYDWSAFDAVIQPYINLGKTINLIVWPISEAGVNSLNNSNHATPAYVMNQVDTVTCTAFPGDGTRAGSYPVVWEPGFKSHYKMFITAVVKHYRGNPHIGYIRFGITGGGAINPQCELEQTPYLPAGNSFIETILELDEDILKYEKSQNPSFSVVAPMQAYQNSLAYADTEALNGIANGFGLGNEGLRKSDMKNYPVCSGDWCNLFTEESYVQPTPIFELQTYGQSDPSATCTPSCWNGVQQQTGPLPALLSFAVEHHANTFEIYSLDLLLALDPHYPGYNQYHDEYQHALVAAHSGVGSAVAVAPAALGFDTFPVGTPSAVKKIKVTNSGTSLLIFHDVTISGDYSQTNTCAAQSLGTGEHCDISVTFTPSAIGRRTGFLRINDSDPWSSQAVGLTGTGQ